MRSDLAQVVSILEKKTASTTVMLNSDNHSMLVAKIFEGEHSNYLFYDPNLGIYEIVTSLAFSDALTVLFPAQKNGHALRSLWRCATADL